jgi:RNA polymerase sigma-70 factor, ECF subfamily
VNYDDLFRELYPSLFRYLQRLTGDPDAADDIAQEAFVRLLRQNLTQEEVRPWLYTVAMNLVRDRARGSERRHRLLAGAPRLTTPVVVPDEFVERTQEIESVRRALDQIPERDRQLLLMREEGFRYDEIARAVGVAPASVGTLIARALKRFAAAYRADGVHDEPRN